MTRRRIIVLGWPLADGPPPLWILPSRRAPCRGCKQAVVVHEAASRDLPVLCPECFQKDNLPPDRADA